MSCVCRQFETPAEIDDREAKIDARFDVLSKAHATKKDILDDDLDREEFKARVRAVRAKMLSPDRLSPCSPSRFSRSPLISFFQLQAGGGKGEVPRGVQSEMREIYSSSRAWIMDGAQCYAAAFATFDFTER